MNVREFIKKYPENDFDMMTPGGFVYLTAEQAKELLAGCLAERCAGRWRLGLRQA